MDIKTIIILFLFFVLIFKTYMYLKGNKDGEKNGNIK